MPITREDILAAYEAEVGKSPKMVTERRNLSYFRSKLETLLMEENIENIQGVTDIYHLCKLVDDELESIPLTISDTLLEGLGEMRFKIGVALIEKIYKRRIGEVQRGNVTQVTELNRERKLANLTFTIYAKFQKSNEDQLLTPEWIQLNEPELYNKIRPLVLDVATRTLNWGKLIPFLPKEILHRAQLRNSSTRPTEATIERMREYRHICESLGPEAMADFMVAQDPEMGGSFEKALNIITRYMGRTATRAMGPADFAGLPDVMFEEPNIREVVKFHLIRYVFREMIREKGDLGTELGDYETSLVDIEKLLNTVMKGEKPFHQNLLNEVVGYYRSRFEMPVPQRLKRKIRPSEDCEEKVEYPSLAQRMVAGRIQSGKTTLANLPMGKGKTSTSFLCKEVLKSKKMLFVCTGGGKMMDDLEAQVSKHYTKKGRPTVGRIESGITQEELDKALAAEIVFIPYSMLSSARQEYRKPMMDQLLETDFDFMTVDEIHWAKNPEAKTTENILKLKEGLKNLKNTLLLSGTPTPNSPADILPQLRLYNPELFSGNDEESQPTLRALHKWITKHDPLALRHALMDFVVNPYEPDQWQKYTEFRPVELDEEHQAIYNAILDNNDMTFQEKMHRLSLAILNPEMIVGQPIENAIVQEVANFVLETFKKHNACVIAEGSYRNGILEGNPDESYESLIHQVEKIIKERVGDAFASELIHGGTGAGDRKKSIQRLLNPIEGEKVLLTAMMDIIRDGVNFSKVHRAIQLEPAMRMPDTAQLVRRFAREGNEDVLMVIFTVLGSIFEGIQKHAQYKFMLIQRLMEGGTLTIDDIRYFEQGEAGEGAEFVNGRFLVGGTEMGGRVRSRLQMLEAYDYYLQTRGRGEVKFTDFLAQMGITYAEYYTESWEGTLSANNARFSSALASKLKREGLFEGNRYADVGCGPLAFENTFGLRHPEAEISSFDLSEEMMVEGLNLLRRRSKNSNIKSNFKVSSMLKIDAKEESFDFLNCGSAFQFLGQEGRKNSFKNEKVLALLEFNRVLAVGGVLQMTLPENACTDQDFENMLEVMPFFGFEVSSEYTGKVYSGRKEEGAISRVLVAKKTGVADIAKIASMDLKKMRFQFDTKVPSLSAHQREASFNTVFNLKGKEFRYMASEGDEDLSLEAREYKDRLYKTRKELHSLYKKNGESFENVNRNNKRELMQLGVLILPMKTEARGEKWVFSFRKDPYAPGKSYYIFDDMDRAR